MGYSPRGRKESDTTERLHFHFLSRCFPKSIPYTYIYVDIYLIYVYIFKIVHLSILTSFSSQQPRTMQRGAS